MGHLEVFIGCLKAVKGRLMYLKVCRYRCRHKARWVCRIDLRPQPLRCKMVCRFCRSQRTLHTDDCGPVGRGRRRQVTYIRTNELYTRTIVVLCGVPRVHHSIITAVSLVLTCAGVPRVHHSDKVKLPHPAFFIVGEIR